MQFAVIGSTGETGKQVVASLLLFKACQAAGLKLKLPYISHVEGEDKKQVIENYEISNIKCLNRRKIDKSFYQQAACKLWEAGPIRKDLTEESRAKVVELLKSEVDEALKLELIDFGNVQPSSFDGCDVVLCCLGSTKAKAGSAEKFREIDYGYTMACAEKARTVDSVKCFIVQTASTADSKSWFLYIKTKGEIEDAVKKLNFPYTAIAKPAVLLCDREESRPMERILRATVKGVDFGQSMSVPTTSVAYSMIVAALRGCNPDTKTSNVEELSNVRMMEENTEFKKLLCENSS